MIKKHLLIVKSFLINTNIVFFIMFFIALVLSINLFITSLPFTESITNLPEIIELQENPISFFIIALLISPLLETMVFQFAITMGVFYLVEYLKKPSFTIPVIVSALAFGLSHYYNLTYVIIGFFVGIALASAYVLLLKRKENAFIIVTLIHSLLNFIPLMRDFFI